MLCRLLTVVGKPLSIEAQGQFSSDGLSETTSSYFRSRRGCLGGYFGEIKLGGKTFQLLFLLACLFLPPIYPRVGSIS